MADDLTPFDFQGQQVRVVMKDGAPWFVAKDVCDCLGYRDAAAGTRLLKPAEKGTHSVCTLGGEQLLTVISEPGLYRLMMRSERTEAEVFQDWVVTEVLPSIRKHGMYAKEELLNNPEMLQAVANKLVEEHNARKAAEALAFAEYKARKEAEARALVAETQVQEQAPMVAFAETCLASKDAILVRELAKVIHEKFGVSTGEKRLYKTLRSWGMILPSSTEPSQRAMDMGLFEVTQRTVETTFGPHLVRTTKITPRGQVYIVDRLMKEMDPVG